MNTPWETPPFAEDLRDADERQESDYRELLIGCGHKRDKRMYVPGEPVDMQRTWRNLVTLDDNPNCKPDYMWDLNEIPWRAISVSESSAAIPNVSDRNIARTPYGDIQENQFNEIHAYEVLEHLGGQGDELSFFLHFSEIWRILKPDGYLLATVPSRFSPWLWGDPSHRRAILPETLIFLDQTQYARQLDGPEESRTSMSDFRSIYFADFHVEYSHDNKAHHLFILRAIKPARLIVVNAQGELHV